MCPRAKGLDSDSCLEGKEGAREHDSIDFTELHQGVNKGSSVISCTGHRTRNKGIWFLALISQPAFWSRQCHCLTELLFALSTLLPVMSAPGYKLKRWIELVIYLTHGLERKGRWRNYLTSAQSCCLTWLRGGDTDGLLVSFPTLLLFDGEV